MKVKLLVPLSGANGSFNRGDIIEVSENEAERFISKDIAESVEAKKKPKGK